MRIGLGVLIHWLKLGKSDPNWTEVHKKEFCWDCWYCAVIREKDPARLLIVTIVFDQVWSQGSQEIQVGKKIFVKVRKLFWIAIDREFVNGKNYYRKKDYERHDLLIESYVDCYSRKYGGSNCE